MTTEPRKRRTYTEDFKQEAVALVTEQGYKIAEAARSLDIGANLLRRWLRQFEEEASGERLSADEREVFIPYEGAAPFLEAYINNNRIDAGGNV